jgi:hypothetical protein
MWLSTVWLCIALVVGLDGHILSALVFFDIYLLHRLLEKRHLKNRKS